MTEENPSILPEPRGRPGDDDEPDWRAREARPKVVVKFDDSLPLPYPSYVPHTATDDRLTALAPQLPNVQFDSQFRDVSQQDLAKLVVRARQTSPDYDPPNFLNLRQVQVEDEAQGQRLADTLRQLPFVDYAYLHPGPVDPPAIMATDDPLAAQQLYLDAAPGGIDARYAWLQPGGAGAGVRLGDIEQGWTTAHEDLAEHTFEQVWVDHQQWRDHGTQVLGVIASHDNEVYCVGITPQIDSILTVGQWRGEDDYVTAEAIVQALLHLSAGDVLLLESQTNFEAFTQVPSEAESAVFDAVELASASHVIVVAAAGNGSQNLDEVVDDQGTLIFDRAVRDSGAIIVGSANSVEEGTAWSRRPSSCFGSRIDCFAAGRDVVTLWSSPGGNRTSWDDSFNNTSAASAIVAGAALALQGVAEARYGARMPPEQLRALLADTGLNTPSSNPAQDRIGVMPDLRAIIDSLPPAETQIRRRPCPRSSSE